jgi:amino acid permease
MKLDETEVEKGHEKIGEFKSIVNLVLTAVGVGVLALPKAIAQSGWAVGCLLLLITWGVSQTMMHLLWKCTETAKSKYDKTIDSYGSVGEAALGKPGRYVVAVATYTGLSAICTIIMILLGGGLYNLTSSNTLDFWKRIAALCILPLSWLPTLKEVGVLSAVGVVAVCVVGVVVVAASIGMSADQRGDISAVPASAGGFAMSFIEFMNSFTVAPVIPTIIVGMKDPSRYPRVAAYGFALITLVFAVIGFAGYAGWGDALLSPAGGNISDEIALSSSRGYSVVCQVAIIVVSLSHFLVMFNPVALLSDGVVSNIPVSSQSSKIVSMVLRILGRSSLVGLMLLAALYVPSFGTVVDLVGSTVVIPLQVLFPIIFYTVICREDMDGMSKVKRTALYGLFIAIACLSLVAMGYGLYNVFAHW